MQNRAEIVGFWAAKFLVEGASKFLTEFHKSGSLSNMWQSVVTIGRVTLEIGQQKKERKKDLSDSSKTESPAIAGGQP